MTDLLESLQSLKQQVQELERRKARKEAEADALSARIREDVARLKEKFGVSTVKEAKKKLHDLEVSLAADINKVQDLLKEVAS